MRNALTKNVLLATFRITYKHNVFFEIFFEAFFKVFVKVLAVAGIAKRNQSSLDQYSSAWTQMAAVDGR